MKKKILIQKQTTYWMFVLPVFLPFIFLFIIPFLMSIYFSLFKWNGIGWDMEFVGLKNYISIFTDDPNYIKTVLFTTKYTILTVITVNILGLLLALLLNSKMKTSGLFRSVFFFPNIISPIIAGFIWLFIFNQGLPKLYEWTSIALFNINWFGTPDIALVAVAIVATWLGSGYAMIIYLSGLQTMDTSILEAASVDGANSFQRLRYVTLPLLMPAITVNLFTSLTGGFRTYDLIMSLTGGGPAKSTVSMALDIYNDGIGKGMAGYASAKAVILFVVVFIITLVQLNITKRREI